LRSIEWMQKNGTMVSHCIYTRQEAERMEMNFCQRWREGELGDWVLTDDDAVVQILRVSQCPESKRNIIGTATMTLNAGSPKALLDTAPRKSRYSLNGKAINPPKHLTAKMETMILLIVSGVEPHDAYMQSHYGDDENKKPSPYTKAKVKSIMSMPAVQEKIQSVLGDKLDSAGMTVEWVLRQYKSIIETGENESAQVTALGKISQFHGLDAKHQEAPLPLPQIPQATLDRLAGHIPVNAIQEDEPQDSPVEVDQEIVDAVTEPIEGEDDEKVDIFVGGFNPDALPSANA
jgi:hypothetical protein